MEEVVYYDVCALEDPTKYRHKFDKEWDAKMGEEWRNHLIKVLSNKGLKRIRGIHGRECHLFTFEGKDEELISINETLDPETSMVRTRLYSSHDSVNEYIQEADRLYNERRQVTFL